MNRRILVALLLGGLAAGMLAACLLNRARHTRVEPQTVWRA